MQVRAYHAFVLDRETRAVLCQASTVDRPELVPAGWADPGGPRKPVSFPYPACQGEALQVLAYAGESARPIMRTALILPVVPVLAWVCGVGLVTGINAELASELWAGAHFTWPLAATGAAGAGLVCGAVGGTGTFLVLYLLSSL